MKPQNSRPGARKRSSDSSPSCVSISRAVAFEATLLSNSYHQVKNTWATSLRMSSWGRPTLARIALRNEFGREPTATEVDDHVKKLKKKYVPLPSMDDVIAALENGEEVPFPSCPSTFVSKPLTSLSYRNCTRGGSSARATKKISSGRSLSRTHIARKPGGKENNVLVSPLENCTLQ
jgi:hypothetical protein